MKQLIINGKKIGDNYPTYLIAEIGFNHEGDMNKAAEMIKAAAQVGVSAVKFQTYKAIDLALPSAPHYELIKCGEIDLKQHKELANIANDCGVDFLSTPYSLWAVDLLEGVGVPAYKVASMDCTSKHLLSAIAQTKKPIYLSTGMATLAEIADTLNFLNEKKSGKVTLLHCISSYPARAEELNLDIIPFLRKIFNVPVGYSDHYPGIQACLAAIILGAEVVETHFTLDVSKKGADHYHSVDPDMLKRLVTESKLFVAMKGSEDSIYNRPDRSMVTTFRRGVYAARNLKKGCVLKEEDILFCRPTSQLSPNDIEWLKNRMLTEDVLVYDRIKRSKLD